MNKIFFENQEIKTEENRDIVGQRFYIENNRFVMRLEEQLIFYSDIFQYQDESILYLKKDETVPGGMMDIVFNFIGLYDFELMKVKLNADVVVKRTQPKNLCVISLNKEENFGDVKFCKINQMNNIEDATVSFSKLVSYEFLKDCVMLNYYEEIEKNKIRKKLCNITLFYFDGKQKSSIIDQEVEGDFEYTTEIANNKLLIYLNKANKKKLVKKLNLED